MKAKLFLILLFPFFLFSQNWEFETLEEYEEFSKSMDIYEYENIFLCYTADGALAIKSFWGGMEDDCKNTRFSTCHTAILKTLIPTIDKRGFDEFKEWILNDLPSSYSSYSNKFNWKNQFKIGVNDINFEFVTEDTGRTIAKAHSPLEGDIRIIINIDKWEKLNNYERIYLLLHEFGHEAFGMKHGDNLLMYPLIPEKLKFDGRFSILMEKSKIAHIKKAEAFAKTMSSLEAREIFMKKVKYKADNEFGNYKEEIEEFGLGYSFNGDSSKVPIALNVLFEALIDFYDFISDNIHNEKTSHDILIIDINKVIGTININKFYTQNK